MHSTVTRLVARRTLLQLVEAGFRPGGHFADPAFECATEVIEAICCAGLRGGGRFKGAAIWVFGWGWGWRCESWDVLGEEFVQAIEGGSGSHRAAVESTDAGAGELDVATLALVAVAGTSGFCWL